MQVGNTVTSVAISLDECFIAFGSMDNHARIYNMLTGASVFERKFKSQVSAVGLSSTGQFMGVGCFGGYLQWLAVDNPDGALHTWEHGKHINTLAVSADDAELAAAGDDNRVTLYSLKSGDVRYVFDALAAVRSVSLAQKEKLKVQLADGTILHNLIDVDFDGSDELENTGTNGHLLSDSTGVRMKTVTRQNNPRQTAGFRRGTVLPRSDTRLLQGQRNSTNRLRVKGVIRSVSDVHGSVTIWTALFETLDSVLWTVAMLVLVIVGAIISLLVIQDEEKYDTKTNNDFTAFITYLFMAEVAVRLNSHWRVKGTLSAFFRNPFCVLDLFCSCIDIFLEVLENSSRSGGNSLSRIPAFSSIRLIRMLRLVRLLKAGRVIERVQERVAAKDRRPLYFDITLRNGDEVKHVHRSALVALDAKAMVGLMDEHAHNIDAVDLTGNDAHSWDAGSERGSRIGASSFSDSFQEDNKTDTLDASSGNGQDGVSRSPSPTTSPSFRSSSPSRSPPYLNAIRRVGDQSDPHDLSKFGSGSINTAGSPTNGAGTRLNDLSPPDQEISLSRRKMFGGRSGGRSNGSPPLGKRPKLSQHLQVQPLPLTISRNVA